MKDLIARSGPDEGEGEDPQAAEIVEAGEEEEGCQRDIHHDPFLIPAAPNLKTLSADVFARIEASTPRPARQRSDATLRRLGAVENIVASLALLALYHPEGRRMAVSLRTVAASRYDRPKFRRDVLSAAISGMEELGLVSRIGGSRGEARTTIEPTAAFRTKLADCSLGGRPLGRLEGAETIILKAKVGRGPKVLVDYEDTAETIAMRRDMGTINEALGRADLRFDGKPLPPFELTRRFQIESLNHPHTFDRLGRLFGGAYQNLARMERHRLRLNGSELVELDLEALLPRLAYLDAGLALPNSDPYDGIGISRKAAKLGLSALLCRTGPMHRLPSKLRAMLPNDWNAERLCAAMAARHPQLAGTFGTSAGLRLFWTESCIIVHALLTLVSKGIVGAPLHDCLFVEEQHEGAARKALATGSMAVVGTVLPVARKEIIRPDTLNSFPME